MECVILCGGQSARMGQEKARLPWQGREIVDVLVERLAGIGRVSLSVAFPGQLAGKPYPRLSDAVPGAGPLGGICTALAAGGDPEDEVFIAACDMPFLTAGTALFLSAALPAEGDAAVPLGPDGWRHPLCAVYRRRAGRVFQEQLEAGRFRLRDALDRLSIAYIPADRLPGGAAVLTNLNTAAAYQTACLAARRHREGNDG